MKLQDRLWISLRHMKSGIVGVILVVLATSVGVALAASTMAFIRSYNEQTKQLLNNPIYREVLVEVLGVTETELSVPVVEYTNVLSRRASLLRIEDLTLALQTVPAVKYAYLANPAKFLSSSYLMEQYPEKAGQKGGDDKERREKKKDDQFSLEDLEETVDIPVDEFAGAHVTTDFFPAYGLSVAQGSLFTQEDLNSGNRVIILGSALNDTLFPQGNAIGARISINLQTFTIIGILKPNNIIEPESSIQFNNLAFVPHGAFAGISYGKRGSFITTIRYAVEDSSDIHQAVLQLHEYFDTEHPGSNLRITASVEKMKSERQKLQRILVVLVFLTTAGLFIAAMNLFNLMLIRIIKHTKGIGIMRALGSTTRDIFRQFMNESLLMSLTGAVIGLAVSPLVFRFLQSTFTSNIGAGSRAYLPDLIIGAAAALVFSLIFGIYPAFMAGQTDAATAIKSE